MKTIQILLSKIESVLGASITPSLSTASNASNIFEAYVFCILIEAAKKEGAKINYSNISGQRNPRKFVFRASPGYIFSAVHPYTYVELLFPKKPVLEAHIDVRVVGKSRVLHECDVAIIDQAEAETCRRKKVSPRSLKTLIGVECKFYSTSLKLHLARAFIGFTSDLSAKQTAVFVTNHSSQSVERLLTARKKKWEHNVNPNYPKEIERLRNKFQVIFQEFKAR